MHPTPRLYPCVLRAFPGVSVQRFFTAVRPYTAAATMQVMAATTKIAAAPKGTVKLQAKPKQASKPAPKPAAAPAKKTGTQKLAAPKPGSTVKKAEPASTTVKKVAAAPASATVKKTAGTQKAGTQKVGTGPSKKITAISLFTPSEKDFRPKQTVIKPAPKILARVEQLRLLSKLEQAGLLSLLEKNGVTLSAIEKSGLLSKAESLGLISAAADRNTPSALYTLATVLLAAGPALVYFTPDDSTGLIVAQVLGALLCVGGGAAAYGGASLLASLQK